MDRREFVTAAGAAGVLSTTSLAGCLGRVLDQVESGGGSDVSEGEPAAYNEWVGPDTTGGNGGVDASSASGAILRTDWGSAQENQRIQDDALAMSVTEWALPIGFASRGVAVPGIADPTAADSNTDRFTLVNGTRVLEGEQNYDTAEVRRAQERNANRSENYEGYTLYIDDGSTTAISRESVIHVSNLLDNVSDTTVRAKAHIDASKNERARYAAEHEAFAELQAALPVRGYTGISFHPDGGMLDGESAFDFTALRDTTLGPGVLGYAGSTDIEDDDMTTAVALRYTDSEAVPDRETIESELGQEADDRAIEIDDSLVIVEGDYNNLSEN